MVIKKDPIVLDCSELDIKESEPLNTTHISIETAKQGLVVLDKSNVLVRRIKSGLHPKVIRRNQTPTVSANAGT